ncbi:MAG: carbohydrate ABC transporter substrate-binding protein [Ruminococcaceae bacterium]|nr:carbohydrate ABC transporter substrate-binding protein [Oscillospiraceae bacterium]
MKKIIFLVAAALVFVASLAGCAHKPELSPNDPVTLTIWHVYGSQTESPLNDSIDEFNKTVGKEKGIVISVVSVSSSSAIDEALTASANNTPGVPALPDLFTAYPRVAAIVGYDKLLDWSEYFSQEELSSFVDEFVAEGYFDKKLLMLPVAKSTELVFLNSTLFDEFAKQAGTDVSTPSTYQDLFDTCEKYYDVTGKDMFQINDFYHYTLTGLTAYGEEIIRDGKPDLSGEAFEKVWTPLAHTAIYGGLCLGDGYASDRWKTGEVICNVGSTAGILYLRDYVTYPDNTTKDIETSITAYPRFENTNPIVVHRGGGLFAVRSEDERKNEAAAIFAKWLTESENNLNFVTKAGYLPVTDSAFELLFENTNKVENKKYRMLYDAVKGMSGEYTFCAIPVFDNASKVQTDFEKNVKLVLKSARAEYLDRTSNGEDKDFVLSELTRASLSKIRSLYED